MVLEGFAGLPGAGSSPAPPFAKGRLVLLGLSDWEAWDEL